MSLKKEQKELRRTRDNGNYTRSFINEVVAEVEAGEMLVAVCLKYDLSKSTLNYWLKHYTTATYRQNRKKCFGVQVRRLILRSLKEGGMTIAQAQSAYNIRSAGTIRRWMALEKQENDDLSEVNKDKSTDPPDAAAEQPMAGEVSDLQQQLADARLKIAALNTLIDVAEEQLKINIRKKPGAKQS